MESCARFHAFIKKQIKISMLNHLTDGASQGNAFVNHNALIVIGRILYSLLLANR